jgi:DNA-directed RNA polymerase specialized sigma24 family protein
MNGTSNMGDEPGADEPTIRIDLERVAAGIDMLPCLTRTVFLLHRWDGHSYEEIARRCGISIDEVEHRMVAALFTVRRCCEGDSLPLVRLRLALRPWRVAWYEWQRRRRDRWLGLR